jgi:periplasmic protein CpxP/Spy
MRKLYRVLAINIGLMTSVAPLASTGWALSQEPTGTSQDAQTSAKMPHSPEEVVQKMSSKLNLTDDQKEQLTPIIAERQQKMSAVKSDTSLTPDQKKAKAKGIYQDSDNKINAILNDQQKQQYAQMEQEKREKMHQHKQQQQQQQEQPQ